MITLHAIDQIQYGVCELSDINEMVMLLADVFSGQDPPAVAMGITASEFAAFVQLFAQKIIDEKLTVVARSAVTGEMTGALLIEDAASPAPGGMTQLSKKFAPIFMMLHELEGAYWHGKVVQPGECLHLFLLGVARAYQRRNVAQNLIRTCLQHGLQKGYHLGITEATNNISQHVFRKLGFTGREQRSYQDYTFAGKIPFASIQGHTGVLLMDKSNLKL